LLELLLVALLAADPSLQAPSPFFLRLTKVATGYEIALLNRSQKTQAYLYDPLHQPLEPIVIDARGKTCTLLDARAVGSSDGRVWKKLYKRLEPSVQTVLSSATVSGTSVDKFRVQAPPFECGYLEPGVYRLSFVWRSKLRACEDCSAAERAELARVWLGAVRSNELEIVLR
jgi:hypothetical protein